jgi:hypothetical protein
MTAKSGLAGSDEDLKSLYNVEATFEYTSRSGLARALRTFREHTDNILDHAVLVTRFPPQLFDAEDDNNSLPVKGKVVYFRNLQILILIMAGGPHEVLAREVNALVGEKLTKMDLRKDFTMSGALKKPLGNVSKEPDESWGPRSVNYHPTCVLEVGLSQSLRAVEVDAQRWIESERSHVTQVMTAKIYPQRREIIFAIWGRTISGKAEKNEEMHIEMHGDQPSVRGDRRLRLFFKELFERSPVRGTSEGDVILSYRELGMIAERVWELMG